MVKILDENIEMRWIPKRRIGTKLWLIRQRLYYPQCLFRYRT